MITLHVKHILASSPKYNRHRLPKFEEECLW